MNHCENCPLFYADCNKHLCDLHSSNPGKWGPVIRDKFEPLHPGESLEIPSGVRRQLVISHFQERLDWVARVPEDWSVVIYSKGGSLDGLPHGVPVRRLANKGREAGSFLYHVVDSWENLAEITVFCQGNPFVHCPDFIDRLALADHPEPIPISTYYTKKWPGKKVTQHDRIESVMDREIRYGDALYMGARPHAMNPPWLSSIWSLFFVNCPQPDPWWFGYSAQWSVPREAIWARPLEFWIRCVEIALDPANRSEMSPGSAWAFEAVFSYLFADPAKYPGRLD